MTDISIDAGGKKLAASVYGPKNVAPVLFLHGISLSRDTWAETAKHLADRYQVWTLDFRGHGDSTRSARYELADYLQDAEAALRMIDRPAIVVGHSLGACVAGMLAQNAHPGVRAAYLEEPPWYLGEVGEWEKTFFPRKFAAVSAQQEQWQRRHAPLADYLAFLSAAPWPTGGVASDHTTLRHLLSHASALQRQDNLCWRDAGAGRAGSGLSAIDTSRPFQRPVKVVVGESRLGSAFLDDHAARLAAVNQDVEIVRYVGSGHEPHRTREFEQRFADDLGNFLAHFEDSDCHA
jgi:pimeloyl-ACP methyl ester carboxylesterase